MNIYADASFLDDGASRILRRPLLRLTSFTTHPSPDLDIDFKTIDTNSGYSFVRVRLNPSITDLILHKTEFMEAYRNDIGYEALFTVRYSTPNGEFATLIDNFEIAFPQIPSPSLVADLGIRLEEISRVMQLPSRYAYKDHLQEAYYQIQLMIAAAWNPDQDLNEVTIKEMNTGDLIRRIQMLLFSDSFFYRQWSSMKPPSNDDILKTLIAHVDILYAFFLCKADNRFDKEVRSYILQILKYDL